MFQFNPFLFFSPYPQAIFCDFLINIHSNALLMHSPGIFARGRKNKRHSAKGGEGVEGKTTKSRRILWKVIKSRGEVSLVKISTGNCGN